MELEPDPHRLAQLGSYTREERSGVWWVTVIALAVFIGNLMSFSAYQLYIQWELKRFTVSLGSAFEKQAEVSKAQMEQAARQNAEARKVREKQNAVNAQLRQTCEFWRQQVARENTAQNRTYRDAACSRAAGTVP